MHNQPNTLDQFFKLKQRGSDVMTEVLAGATTFLTASYILFVHPNMLSATGMDQGALITVTGLAASLATLLVALLGNAPLMMAPGMGLNAFFTYTLVLGEGLPWQTALGVVFLSGALFLILSWFGAREHVLQVIPQSLRLATAVGIGLFIAFIGLQNLGVIVKSPATLVQLGEFTTECCVGLGALLLILVLEIRRVRGAILIGIAAATGVGMALGLVTMPGQIASMPPSPAPLLLQLDIMSALSISLWSTIFSFMFVDLFDSLGTMMAVCREANMVDEKGDIPMLSRLLYADALATIGGALLGTSTTTAFIESASGVSDGGRTGLSSVVTAVLFLLALFFSPVIAVVPAFATAPALLIVGLFMMRSLPLIDFKNLEVGAPAFLTIIIMPLGYSIATGLSFGLISHVVIYLAQGKIRQCHPTLIVISVLSVIGLLH
ncbi:MAG: NCS2 family permease [Desulfuromonas sp.]|nr:NCS2 family permease [Desulfuromonas sp.]